MRWFKHMMNAGDGETLQQLRYEMGHEGVGIYWAIVEMVAARCEADSTDFSLTLPEKVWCQRLGITRPKLHRCLTLVGQASDARLAHAGHALDRRPITAGRRSDYSLTVTLPKLAELRDDWSKRKSRNSGVTTEKPYPEVEQNRTEQRKTPYSPPPESPQNRLGPASNPDRSAYVEAYCRGMDFPPDSLTVEYGMFHLIEKLEQASGSLSEVEEVAGFYRTEVAGYSNGARPSFKRFVERYREIRTNGRHPVAAPTASRKTIAELEAECLAEAGR